MGEGEFPKDRCSKDDVIDIDGLVFNEMLPGENLFPLQNSVNNLYVKRRIPNIFLHSQALQYLMDPERFKWKQLIFVSQGNKDPSAAFNEDLLTEITEYCK
ncbi:hypothetical protein AHAS_Ahas07G0114300 [Arachis hypogaea]